MMGHPSFDRARGRAKVLDVHFASEVLETTVVLSTGQLLHWKFGFAQLSETEAIQEQVEESILREEAEQPNLMIPPVTSPRHAARSSLSIASPRSEHSVGSSRLDSEMAQAMKEMGVDDQGTVQTWERLRLVARRPCRHLAESLHHVRVAIPTD